MICPLCKKEIGFCEICGKAYEEGKDLQNCCSEECVSILFNTEITDEEINNIIKK